MPRQAEKLFINIIHLDSLRAIERERQRERGTRDEKNNNINVLLYTVYMLLAYIVSEYAACVSS